MSEEQQGTLKLRDNNWRIREMTSLITLLLLAVASLAQAPAPSAPAASPTFEVASVKLNKSGRGSRTRFAPDHFTATNMTVRRLIIMAYQIRDFQLSGRPSWIDSDHYDIDAKAETDSRNAFDFHTMTDDQRKANAQPMYSMIQALLADRFRLAVHTESREGTVYWLVISKNGPKIKELPPTSAPTVINAGNGELHAEGIKLADLLDALVEEVGHPVIDKTSLAGAFNLDLKWSPDHGRVDAPDQTDAGPSIFTALQEQLGLKLEPHKAPINVLVIDHAEKPTEN